MSFEVRAALIITAIILFIISHFTGTEGHRRAKRFDWEKYSRDVSREKSMNRPSTKFTSAKIIADAKQAKSYVIGLDTNILIEDYRILDKLVDADVAVVLSNKVRQELDGLKKHENEDVRDYARLALKSIYELEMENKLQLVEATARQAKELGLDMRDPDENIIASYLSYAKPVLFFTNDNNARLTAKQRKLQVQELKEAVEESGDPFKIKPGNKLKWVSLVSYCAALALTVHHMATLDAFASSNEPVVISDTESIEDGFKEKKLNVTTANRFAIKNEFDTYYFGDHHEEWGGVALYDVQPVETALFKNGTTTAYNLDFAFYIKESKADDFNDLMKMKVSDGAITFELDLDVNELGRDSKVRYSSTGASVNMYGVNSWQTIMTSIYYNEKQPLNIQNTVITIYNSMTNEELFTLPASVHAMQLEGDQS